ncbi:lytic murein transglycosylase [Pseudodesulfovibrio sediminis]|uniref:lytic murein transglycosylase n=1 Tax=Pseudodesulfovibrio sediminis TaxID=2810563 RepID=UPI001E4C5721|nr:lytic murein transglycosylase [Pseudodesulfovibrio sediminis]
MNRLVEDGLDEHYVTALFSNPDLTFSPEVMARKMDVLLNTKLSAATSSPSAEPEVLSRYLNPILIAGAYSFYMEYRADFVVIEQKYGVPGELLTAILLVETRLGRNVGEENAFTILSSMALAKDFSLIESSIKRKDISDETRKWLIRRTEQKGDWGYAELKALIKYALAIDKDPLSIPSSIYGAIGQCQFMPTSAEHYGRDGTGDGKVDLSNTQDALHSMANFVASHGWKNDLSEADQLKVIYRYNHSESYAMTILSVADKIRKTKELFGG